MNIFSVHTNSLDRKVLFSTFINELHKKKNLVVYNYKLTKVAEKLLEKMEIESTEYENPFPKETLDEKYDVVICFSVPTIDAIKRLNTDNLLILGTEYYIPRELSKFFEVDRNKIHSFEKEKTGGSYPRFSNNRTYLIRENSKFTSFDSDQLVRFITRDIKLNSLLR